MKFSRLIPSGAEQLKQKLTKAGCAIACPNANGTSAGSHMVIKHNTRLFIADTLLHNFKAGIILVNRRLVRLFTGILLLSLNLWRLKSL